MTPVERGSNSIFSYSGQTEIGHLSVFALARIGWNAQRAGVIDYRRYRIFPLSRTFQGYLCILQQ